MFRPRARTCRAGLRSGTAIPVITAALALATAPTLAQTPPDTVRLAEIVVTATRGPLPRAAVPAAVTVLEGDALRRRGIRQVTQALRSVPGVALARSGSSGALASLFVRGGESNYVRVLIDGVAINEPGGAVDLSHIAAAEVERIEIVRGPTSVLYGSDAVAGVIQIFTRRGSAGTPRIEAAVEAGLSERVGSAAAADGPLGLDRVGERSTAIDWSAAVAGTAGAVRYAASFARHEDEGAYALNNAYDRVAANARLGVSAGGVDFAVHARHSDGRYHFPTNSSGVFVDANQFSDAESTLFGIDALRAIGDRVTAAVRLASHGFERVTEDAPDAVDDTLGTFASTNLAETRRRTAELQLDFAVRAATTLTLGAAAERQDVETAFSSQSEFGPFESASENDRTTKGVFAQIVARPTTDLTMTGGARAEDNERFGSFVTWRAGVNLRAGETLLRAAAGTAFKEPTFFENYAEGFVRGNPDLAPERSLSWELGAEMRLLDGRAVIGATYFDQRFRDLIQYFGAAPPDQPNYRNLAGAAARGVELATLLRAGRVEIDAGYAYVATEATDAGDEGDLTFIEGRPLLRRPAHSGSASALLRATDRLDLGAGVNVVGVRSDVAFLPDFTSQRVELNAYATLDLSAEYTLVRSDVRRLGLTLRVRNALDERYSEAFGFHAPGRALWIGLRGAM